MTIIKENDPNLIFAALKLIEQLYLDGKITEIEFKNILKDWKETVDISKFRFTKKQKEASA